LIIHKEGKLKKKGVKSTRRKPRIRHKENLKKRKTNCTIKYKSRAVPNYPGTWGAGEGSPRDRRHRSALQKDNREKRKRGKENEDTKEPGKGKETKKELAPIRPPSAETKSYWDNKIKGKKKPNTKPNRNKKYPSTQARLPRGEGTPKGKEHKRKKNNANNQRT